jgi:hypothetical protein
MIYIIGLGILSLIAFVAMFGVWFVRAKDKKGTLLGILATAILFAGAGLTYSAKYQYRSFSWTHQFPQGTSAATMRQTVNTTLNRRHLRTLISQAPSLTGVSPAEAKHAFRLVGVHTNPTPSVELQMISGNTTRAKIANLRVLAERIRHDINRRASSGTP